MTRTRISLVTLGDANKQSGGYLYHRRLAEAAPRHGAEISFFSLPERPFPLTILSARDPIHRASGGDVIVVDSIAAAAAGPWLSRLSVPIVGMLHQGPGGIDHGSIRTRVQARLDVYAYARMKGLLVASESLAGEIRSKHRRIRVVPPGRDVAGDVAADRVDLRHGRRAAFLCVGNWVARKGIVELLDAFAKVPAPAATLHLVGDERVDRRYAARVHRRLRRLGDRVVTHGVVPKERVAALYRNADVFVMPSYREPYGTVYGEAMAAGLPVVGWRAGNLAHLIEDGREGYVIRLGDVDALAGALERLCDDVELRARMGEAARARADSLPSWEETAALFFTQLRSLIESR